MELYRNEMKRRFINLLQDKDYIHATWEGGSAATGYLDEFSDLDLIVIADDDSTESVFLLVEKFLTDEYGIKQKYRVPEPCWHGMSQCFYRLENSPQFFFVDFAVQKLSTEDRFLEQDRHGNAVIWFDKKNLVKAVSMPGDMIESKGKRAFKNVTESFFLISLDIYKSLKRGRDVDALESYYRGCLGRLAIMLNLKYRPAKYDFNMRYSYRDYPKEVNEKLKRLMLVNDITELETKTKEVEGWFDQLKLELKNKWA